MSYGTAIDLTGLDDLLPRMEGRLPGCPPVLIRQTLQDIARQFCMDTGALRSIIGPFDFVEDQAEYEIELPILATVLKVHKVWIGGIECHPSTYAIQKNEDMDSQIVFAVAPVDDLEDAWTADVSMTPGFGCEEYPSSFLEEWGHAIIAGTLEELMSDDTKRWFNRNMAVANGRKYSLAKQSAVFGRLAAGTKDGRLTFQNDETFAGGFY